MSGIDLNLEISPMSKFNNSRFLVVGTARDVANTLISEINCLYNSLINSRKLTFFIVESDSRDNTVRLLDELATQLPDFNYVSLGNLSNHVPSRIERLSIARNTYLNYVKQNVASFDYVIVADLDGINFLLTEEKIVSCFKYSGWGCCTANQVGPYYDVFALRADSWCETDCWSSARKLASSGMNPLKAWRISIRDKQIRIPQSRDWISVNSAFGGLAIYDIQAFIVGAYSTNSDNETGICEHVAFNLDLKKAGWKIFINPALTNFDFNSHNDFDKLTRKLKFAFKFLYSYFFPQKFISHMMPELKL